MLLDNQEATADRAEGKSYPRVPHQCLCWASCSEKVAVSTNDILSHILGFIYLVTSLLFKSPLWVHFKWFSPTSPVWWLSSSFSSLSSCLSRLLGSPRVMNQFPNLTGSPNLELIHIDRWVLQRTLWWWCWWWLVVWFWWWFVWCDGAF